MMTADLAAWLLADDGPIAEDQMWATDALMKGDWNGGMSLHDYREPVGQHIARWNPGRVLAECAAKRQIVVLASQTYAEVSAVLAMRALAQPYAGRPGWQDEWATT